MPPKMSSFYLAAYRCVKLHGANGRPIEKSSSVCIMHTDGLYPNQQNIGCVTQTRATSDFFNISSEGMLVFSMVKSYKIEYIVTTCGCDNLNGKMDRQVRQTDGQTDMSVKYYTALSERHHNKCRNQTTADKQTATPVYGPIP